MGLLIGVGTTRPTFAYDCYYGVEWDTTVSNPQLTRIGKAELHQSLPLQSRMRRCILNNDGTVNYALHPNNSTLRDNSAAATLDGSHGQVMVELPEMYVRFEMDGTKRRCLMSDRELPGFIKWERDYVSAYEATVERATSKLASVANATAAYRGGENNADWDGSGKSLLGKPASNINLNNFRNYARNRGSVSWNCYTYQIHRKLTWLFVVEYATFNSQDDFNAVLTENGYHQGGLGEGVTTMGQTVWLNYNNSNPVIPCGVTNSLGNHTGTVGYALPAEYGTLTVQVPSYRGVENPFGHLGKLADGCRYVVFSGKIDFYVCDNPANFTTSGTTNYQLRGIMPLSSTSYIKEINLGEFGDIMPLTVGAGSTAYFCDVYMMFSALNGSEFVGNFGGSGEFTSQAGMFCVWGGARGSEASAKFGTRLCFIPQIETS
jgi:hypothetical protein